MDYKEKVIALLKSQELSKEQKEKLENIFPELKESKDEKIRKGLIKAVSWTFEGTKLFGTDVTREEALAWLEKQGEKKSQRMISAEAKEAMYGKPAWSEEDEQHIDSLLKRLDGLCRNEFERTRFAINEDKDWLESLKQRIGG